MPKHKVQCEFSAVLDVKTRKKNQKESKNLTSPYPWALKIFEKVASKVFTHGIDNLPDNNQYVYYKFLIKKNSDFPSVTVEEILDFVVVQEWLPMTVSTKSGLQFGIMTKALMTVGMVKEMIEEKQGYSQMQYRLCWKGKSLRDDLTLSEYGLVVNSRLQLSYRYDKKKNG